MQTLQILSKQLEAEERTGNLHLPHYKPPSPSILGIFRVFSLLNWGEK